MIDFQIVGLEAWDSVATRSEHSTHKPQTDHKVQVKGIMVVCYFGIVFNRSSQLDHWFVGLPLCEAKRHHKSTIFNRNFIQEKNDRFWNGGSGMDANLYLLMLCEMVYTIGIDGTILLENHAH